MMASKAACRTVWGAFTSFVTAPLVVRRNLSVYSRSIDLPFIDCRTARGRSAARLGTEQRCQSGAALQPFSRENFECTLRERRAVFERLAEGLNHQDGVCGAKLRLVKCGHPDQQRLNDA